MDKKAAVVGITDRCAVRPSANTGNAIHGAAARRFLKEYRNFPLERPWRDDEVEWINQCCSHIVWIAANGLRPGASNDAPIVARHRTLLENLKRTEAPIVVFGLGAQVNLNRPDERLPENTVRLMRLVSDRSIGVAVRGRYTAELLRAHGIDNPVVLGCQSCFFHFDRKPSIRRPDPNRPLKTSVNITKYRREEPILLDAIRNGRDLIGQEEFAEYQIAARRRPGEEVGAPLPGARPGSVSVEDYAAYIRSHFHQFFDPYDWIRHMESYDFSFGTRFHGNMAALIAGAPALWLTHDSRTVELCEHLNLPSMPLEKAVQTRDAEKLLEAADFGRFEAQFQDRYKMFYDYVAASGVPHVMPAPAC